MISHENCVFDKTGTMLFRLIGPDRDSLKPQCLKCARLPGEDCIGYTAEARATKCYRMRAPFRLVPMGTPADDTLSAAVPAHSACTGSTDALVIDAPPADALASRQPATPLGGTARPTTAVEAKAMGFTGNPCTRCGSIATIRNGTCVLCADCGETTGCS